MLTRDLQPVILSEAPLSPGEERTIDLKIDDYLEQIQKLDQYMDNMKRFDQVSHPTSMMDKVQAIKKKYEDAVEQMRNELKPKGARLDKTVQSLQKNCSQVLETYQSAGRFWSIKTPQTVDMFYAKTPVTEVTPEMATINKILQSGYKAEAVFGNSKHLYRALSNHEYDEEGSKTNVYDVFPVNGTKYTQMDSSLLDSMSSGVNNLFDRRRVEDIFRALNQNADVWREYRNRAAIHYGSVYDIVYSGGFCDENWEKHFAVAKQMVEEGKIPDSVLPLLDTDKLVTKEGFENRFTIETGPPTGYLQDVLAKGAYFAVNRKFQPYLFKALGIRKDYWQCC